MDLQRSAGVVLVGRSGDLNQVFVNLLDNAIRAVGGDGLVEVRSTVEAGAYVLRVGDSGPGVDPAVADRLFDPFVTTRPAGQGTGLGLSVVRKIVEQHGGTVDVSRSVLGGALFTVRVPLPRAEGSRSSESEKMAAR